MTRSPGWCEQLALFPRDVMPRKKASPGAPLYSCREAGLARRRRQMAAAATWWRELRAWRAHYQRRPMLEQPRLELELPTRELVLPALPALGAAA